MENKIEIEKDEQVLYSGGFNYMYIGVTVAICVIILVVCLYNCIDNSKTDNVSPYSLIGVVFCLVCGYFLVKYIKSLEKLKDDELLITSVNIKWVANGKADSKSWQQIESFDVDFTSDNKTFLIIKPIDEDAIRLDLTYIEFNLKKFCTAVNEAYSNNQIVGLEKCNTDVIKETGTLLNYKALRRKRISNFSYDYVP